MPSYPELLRGYDEWSRIHQLRGIRVVGVFADIVKGDSRKGMSGPVLIDCRGDVIEHMLPAHHAGVPVRVSWQA